MENVSISIHNYQYSQKQIKSIENKLESLIRQIPCNSRLILDFKYRHGVFYGKLKTELEGKSFFATDEAEILLSLTSSLCKKTQKQIMKWKKSRTVEEITGIIPLKPYFEEKREWMEPSNLKKAL